MKRVFLDTNVILDAVIPIRENYQGANAILSAVDFGEIEGCVSLLTVANAAYILRKGRTSQDVVHILRETLEGITILPMDGSQVQRAYQVEAPDFEDVLQYECAKAAGCDCFVTGNVKHFRFCNDIVVVPTADYARQFLDE